MQILEVGIMARGYPLVYTSYFPSNQNKPDIILKTAILTGIINFVKGMFSINSIEYIESSKYIVVFQKGSIIGKGSINPETIFAYAIVSNKQKNRLEKLVLKRIQPDLTKVLKYFQLMYQGLELSSVYKFRNFKYKLDKYFLKGSKTPEQRFKALF
ncbi:MAG TPA: hypothetical protein VGB37_03815 [Candidatus Lokiarchaeia archaeon]